MTDINEFGDDDWPTEPLAPEPPDRVAILEHALAHASTPAQRIRFTRQLREARRR